ncbi:MAG TPA: ATP-binding protein [Thermoanaerobacterales bacterium]|nr:ATP-binding protein [Thermoanaerobacterales bacterium]
MLKPRISVIENTILKDICGSELIDLIAEMFLTGIIDMKGKII